jgi:hypothetical protein
MTNTTTWRPDEGVWCSHESEYPDDLEDREHPFIYPASCYRMDEDTYFAVSETYLRPSKAVGVPEFRLFEGILIRKNKMHLLVTRLVTSEADEICRDDWKDNLDFVFFDEECIAKIQNFADFNNYSTPTPLASAFLIRELRGIF